MNSSREANHQSRQNGSKDQSEFDSFKKFLVDSIIRLENQARNDGEDVTMVKLTPIVSESPYSYFLRSNYVIDSRSLLKRINLVLYQCPETFRVDYDTGKVRLTTDKERNNLKKQIVELAGDFLTLCLSFQPDSLIPIKQLHNYLYLYASDIVKDYLKDYDKFIDFLKCSKDLFRIEDDYICQANKARKMEKRKFDLFRREETRIDEKLNDKVCFVYNLDMGKRVCKHILSSVKMIAIDTEGTHLGALDGRMTLVQIAFLDTKLLDLEQTTIIDNIQIYFFDIQRCESLVEQCIKPILESKDIIKIMHDLKNDFMAFEGIYGIHRIHNIFDSSTSYFTLSKSHTNGLHTIYEEVTGLTGQNLKPKMKQMYQQNDRLWEDRPLSDFLKFYAAMDVLALLSIYLHLEKKYDFSKYKKTDLFVQTLFTNMEKKLVYSEDCMNPDEYDSTEESQDEAENKLLEKMETIKKKKPCKPNKFNNMPDQAGPYKAHKKTSEDLEKLRQRFANLERLARGEVRVKQKN